MNVFLFFVFFVFFVASVRDLGGASITLMPFWGRLLHVRF